ncbi:membrane-associated tyrosine- and threonine-specific cdc2-inhibitory kinase [Aethina tumida]|uniref:membrane-associated tyrosine- and threonine-specific cdc2-inhibitory kinase n=1 Tax=Aethina tumida TaxID=116153 RepID=UPI00096B437B|nr:membrane-associated tyrosine- and threonine-specific cdc2-inhibitory kinase [Aethina tumida]
MANRRRGKFSLPAEFQTQEKISTKKELALRNTIPSCPAVPSKIKKGSTRGKSVYLKPRPVFVKKEVKLSQIYDPSNNMSYLDQVFKREDTLGEGSFGVVFKAKHKENGQTYAIKKSKPNVHISDRYAEIINNEKVGAHFNIIEYFMSWEENSDMYMLMELGEMSLANFTHLQDNVPEDMLWNILMDCCKGLEYLHSKALVHLDIKPGNIVLKEGYFKLADFGILVDLKLDKKERRSTLSEGDAKYVALEVLEGVYTPSCDMFGLGITLLECAADLALPECGPLWHQLRHGHLPYEFYARVSLGFSVLIEHMLSNVYTSRPSATRILKYSCMKDLARRDTKFGRTNYAAAYLNLRDNNQAYHNRWGVAELEQPLETNNNIEITREEQMTVEEKPVYFRRILFDEK